MNYKLLPLILLLWAYSGLFAQPGTIDIAFNPTDLGFNNGGGADGSVTAMTMQPDGKILIIGDFTSYNGTARNRIARLNADGTLDISFNPGTGASNTIQAMVLQPDGKILIGGNFTGYHSTTRFRIARLNADGTLDVSFNPGTGANNSVEAIALQPDGKILIGGQFTSYNGTARNYVARLNANGSLDTGFDPGTGANDLVYAMVLQPDGKVLIGGNFYSYNGTARNYVARLNADGSLDAGFNPGTGANSYVESMALQPDGKILIGGQFTSYNGTARNYIARLNANGSLDTSFDPGTGPNNFFYSIALQPDGKILIAGDFTSYNGTARNRIARLNADGTLDVGFNPGTGANGTARAIALQPDGKILIGGTFTEYNSATRIRITRLNADGTLDVGFNPGTGANGTARAIVLQPDGRILIGGTFTEYNSATRIRITRLNADGTLDVGFNPGTGANGSVETMALQPDGKILIGGYFTSYNGTGRNGIARLNADGTLDTGFNPGTGTGANGWLSAIALQPDGKILIGGSFTDYNGTGRNNIARINADGTLDMGFNPGSGTGGTISGAVMVMALQPDGKILIGGFFSVYNNTTRRRVARVNADGSLDTSFDPGSGIFDGGVFAIALQADGKILIGGAFSTYNGTTRWSIARLNTDGSLSTGYPGLGVSGELRAIALQPDGKILIGGSFTGYNSTARNHIARLNSDGSLDTGFNIGTGANSGLWAIALQPDGKILIGGDFTGYDGTGRNRIARLNGDVGGACSISIGSITAGHESCPGVNDGNIAINATCTGCIGALEYSINNGGNFHPGSTFSSLPDGVYPIVIRDAGNTSCSVTGSATVNAGVDNQAPVISCPADITVSNDAGNCSAIVTFSAPTGTDNCPGATTAQTAGQASGTAFPVGTTINSFVVTAANGQTAGCSFTVTVADNEPPVISCPADITVSNDAGNCSAIVTFSAPTGTDNCPGATTAQTAGQASGTAFPVGTTINSFVVTAANGQTAGCSFTVTVVDNEPPVISCPADITVSNDAGNCSAIVTFSAPTGTDNCPGATTAQTAGQASGTAFPVGTTINTFVVTAANSQTAGCSFTVTVVDNEPPVISCPADITVSNDAGNCSAIVTFSAPTGTDNCPGATTAQTAGQASGTAFPVGTTINSFVVTAANGQTAGCSFTVTVVDNEPPVISCPADITVSNDAGNCSAVVTFSAYGTDCSTGLRPVVQTAGQVSGTVFPVGTTINAFLVTAANGLTADCSFTVTVVDNEPPAINCPANITMVAGANQTTATVNYTAPIGTDNCPGATTVQTTGLASGAIFPLGTATNTFTVTAANGQTAGCSFTVTVVDNQSPMINCPADITVSNDAGDCSAVVTFSAPTVVSSTGLTPVQTAGLASGTAFPVGTTINTFVVTAANGQTAGCSFNVTVVDNEPPVISCPANLSVCSSPASATYQGVAIGTALQPTFTDNCVGSLSYSFTTSGAGASPAGGSGLMGTTIFEEGTSTVVYTAQDPSGNSSTCSFTVTVLRSPRPSWYPRNLSTCNGTLANLAPYAKDGSNTATKFVFWQGIPSLMGSLRLDSISALAGAMNPTGQKVQITPPGNNSTSTVTKYYLVSITTYPGGPTCLAISAPFSITVKPTPSLSYTLNSYTSAGSPNILTGSTITAGVTLTPGSAVFSSSQTNNNIMNPATPAGLAMNSTSVSFVVTNTPNISSTLRLRAILNGCVRTVNVPLRSSITPAPPATPSLLTQPGAELPVAEVDGADFIGLFTVYPNPFREQLLIRNGCDLDGMLSLQLYDLNGRELASRQWLSLSGETLSFDIRGLPKGVYVYRLQLGEHSQTGRVMRQ